MTTARVRRWFAELEVLNQEALEEAIRNDAILQKARQADPELQKRVAAQRARRNGERKF